jgi:hypothetical protein
VYILPLNLMSMYERKHEAFVYLSLAYFTLHDVLQLHPFTFKPHVIFAYGWITYSIVYIYNIFLIHSAAVQYLGCFQKVSYCE